MKKSEVKKLKQLILVSLEKTYRRGVQHGNYNAHSGVTKEHCINYRFGTPLDKSYGQPEKHACGTIACPKPFGNNSLENRHLGSENIDLRNFLDSLEFNCYE